MVISYEILFHLFSFYNDNFSGDIFSQIMTQLYHIWIVHPRTRIIKWYILMSNTQSNNCCQTVTVRIIIKFRLYILYNFIRLESSKHLNCHQVYLVVFDKTSKKQAIMNQPKSHLKPKIKSTLDTNLNIKYWWYKLVKSNQFKQDLKFKRKNAAI